MILEPHADDAALSVSGRLLAHLGKINVTIISVTGKSNISISSKSCFGAQGAKTVSKVRRAESLIFSEQLGAKHLQLEELDAPLRFKPAKDWTRERVNHLWKEFWTWQESGPSIPDTKKLETLLREPLRELHPDLLWIPAGMGRHIDHLRTRNACLRLIKNDWKNYKNCSIELYHDFPYSLSCTTTQVKEIRREVTQYGFQLRAKTYDISKFRSQKRDLIMIFRSQFTLSRTLDFLRMAMSRNSGRLCEGFFQLVKSK